MEELLQKKFWWRRQIIKFDESKINLTLKRPFYREEFSLELSDLYSNAVRLIKFPYLSLLLSITFLALSAPLTIYSLKNFLTAAGALAGLCAICAFLIFLGTFSNFIQKRQNVVVFSSANFQIILWNNRPSKAAFESFVTNLIEAIKKVKEKRINIAMNVVKKLHQDGIINEWQYTEAVNLISKETISSNIQ